MEKRQLIITSVAIISLIFIFNIGFNNITGNVVGNLDGEMMGNSQEGYGGPTAEESACLYSCVVENNGEEGVCMAECGVAPQPEPADESEVCMQECIIVGCEEYDNACELANVDSCEIECGMIGESEDDGEKGAEELCITNCVNSIDPSVICGASQEGETGGELCQSCANECVHLYAGPCLNNEQLSQRETECETCEHCYGDVIEGPSGQGWDCIVDVKCEDASAEFGEDSGTGPGIGQEGYVAPNPVAGAVDGVIKFFKGLFGGGEDASVIPETDNLAE